MFAGLQMPFDLVLATQDRRIRAATPPSAVGDAGGAAREFRSRGALVSLAPWSGKFPGCQASKPDVHWRCMSQSPIDSLAAGVEDFSQNCCLCLEDCEEQIRQQPWISVLIAAAIGYLLHFLPVGRILASVVRSLLVLVKPALIVLGILKLVSCVSEGKAGQK